MEIGQAVLEAGGVASWRDLTSAFSRAEIHAALRCGELVRLGRDTYAVPGLDRDRAAAAAIGGVLDRLSEARWWGWGVKLPPEAPQLLVPRGRNVDPVRRRGVDLKWGSPTEEERARGVTSRVQTVLDCARLPRTGHGRAYRVVELADARAANPFESVLRAVLLDVPGTRFEPRRATSCSASAGRTRGSGRTTSAPWSRGWPRYDDDQFARACGAPPPEKVSAGAN